MEIKLNKLTIRNFKGIKDFTLKADGSNISVSGDNGTGKTTLYDAFLWCLFGKDSTDKTKFDWKPLNKDGQELHRLETEVEVELLVDGSEKTISRLTKENWSKKRGHHIETFSGHNTTFKLDGIEAKQKDFKAYLDTLISEDTFRMLTNLTYFPETMKWEERRKVLVELAGDVSVEQVIASNDDLKPLYQLLAERNLSDNMALTRQEMKSINNQIKDIPQRIDEVDRSMPDLSNLDETALKADLDAKQSQVDTKRDEISVIKNGAVNAKTSEAMANLKLYYSELENNYNKTLESDLDKLIEKRQVMREELSELKLKFNGFEQAETETYWEKQKLERLITQLTNENAENRVKFQNIREQEMPSFDEHALSCPTCGQEFAEEKAQEIQANYDKETEEFNKNKSDQLEKIVATGQASNAAIAKHQEAIDALDKKSEETADDKAKHTQNVEAKEKQIADITESIERERKSLNPFDTTEEATSLLQEIGVLKDKLEKGEQGQAEEIKGLESQIVELQTEAQAIQSDLMQFDQHTKQMKRRNELIASEQTLALEYGKLEQRLFLFEEFVKARVNLLTDTINSKFKLVKFKLFETAINGGIQEVCEPTVNGANYSTGLNNAARINAGLDIINTLMTHYGKQVPVFIDNAESINEILPIETQLITLTVSKDKTLKVEGI